MAYRKTLSLKQRSIGLNSLLEDAIKLNFSKVMILTYREQLQKVMVEIEQDDLKRVRGLTRAN